MQYGKQPKIKEHAAGGAFKRKRGDALDLSEDKPKPKDEQSDRQDVRAPAKDLQKELDRPANEWGSVC